MKNIVETAIEAGSFKTLVKAVQTAGLVETLSKEGPFTVFAPTDAAFAKLPEGTIEALLKDKQRLKAVLTYHVVAGKVMSKDVMGLKSAKTLQGQEVSIDTTKGVKINEANVVKTDIETTNGVIHVIDTVILPK
ncbi:MAG: fasciclin domain-containing protein [Candidatus Hodarchaeota archaeon]